MNKTGTFCAGLALGTVCGILNILLNRCTAALSVPLFMDTVFTVAASFVSLPCGMTAAVVYHLCALLLIRQPSDIAFLICSLTVVLFVRIARRNFPAIHLIHLLLLSLTLGIVISMEGSIIYTVIYRHFEYIESKSISSLSFLLRQNIPLLLSALLVRIPLNILDKAIAVFGGWGAYRVVKRCDIFKAAS